MVGLWCIFPPLWRSWSDKGKDWDWMGHVFPSTHHSEWSWSFGLQCRYVHWWFFVAEHCSNLFLSTSDCHLASFGNFTMRICIHYFGMGLRSHRTGDGLLKARRRGRLSSLVETSSRSRSLRSETSCGGGWGSPREGWRGCLNLYYMRHSMGRGDSSMPSVVTSSKGVLPDKTRVSPKRVAPTVAFAGVVARVEELFESLLAEAFS
jgi:hypothetical protein